MRTDLAASLLVVAGAANLLAQPAGSPADPQAPAPTFPAEIEQVIAEHPSVADVGVFGIPDEEWGETVKAAIELRPGEVASDELAAAILEFARTQLAGYKIPRSIDFEDTLPRHPSGKLYTRRLRDRYWAGRDKQI